MRTRPGLSWFVMEAIILGSIILFAFAALCRAQQYVPPPDPNTPPSTYSWITPILVEQFQATQTAVAQARTPTPVALVVPRSPVPAVPTPMLSWPMMAVLAAALTAVAIVLFGRRA